jgi:hypothetical protein
MKETHRKQCFWPDLFNPNPDPFFKIYKSRSGSRSRFSTTGKMEIQFYT